MAEPTDYQKQIREEFDKLTEEQKRNVLNWGNPEGLSGAAPQSSAAIAFPKTDYPALEELRKVTGGLNENAEVNRATVDMLLNWGKKSGEPIGLTMDPYLKIYPQSDYAAVRDLAGAGVNMDAVQALSTQMSRLQELYPGTMSRMNSYMVGYDPERGALAWFRPGFKRPGMAPGELPYDIGSPAQATFLRRMIGPRYHPNQGEMMTAATPVRESDWHAYNRALYPSQLEGTMTHELGHATQNTMRDFVKGLPEGSQAAKDFDYLTNVLAYAGPGNNAISGYAAEASRQAVQKMPTEAFRASEEPFAELFSVARSPQGLDIGNSNLAVRSAAIKDVIGNRSNRQAETLIDRIGALNSTEKSLRNAGFNEVGSVAPEMALQLGLPALAGLMASKTHGNVKAALQGAAVGGGIGGLAGPEGTLIGAGLGAGANLVRQLL